MVIRVERLTEDNFNTHSLDNFIRHQVVTECLRNVDGNWMLLPAGVSSVSTQVCVVVVAGSAPVQLSPDM